MALSKPCAVPDSRIEPPPAAFGASVLPLDAWHDILLRLPAKELCRLRVVCRPWRRLLSDPHFIAAHGARHSAPLFVVGQPWYSRGDTLLEIMDLSGNVIRRFRKTAAGKAKHEWAMASAPSDLVTVGEGDNITGSYSCRLLNPGTGSVQLLPEGDGAVDVRERHISSAQIGPTGAHNVLCVIYFISNDHSTDRHVYEVFAIDGRGQARWMGKKASPQVNLDLSTSVVVKNIVYFLMDTLCCAHQQDVEADHIVLFDLEKEEWGETLRGPLSSRPGHC
ncbi:hypothetical protein ACP70R_048134 [Stipagrostis hirtigluma subsp. patula]